MGIKERRAREKEKRRNQIIKAARKTFIKFGFENASIKQIAKEAELSPRTVYTYFGNKGELYGAVLLSGLKLLYKDMERVASAKHTPVEAMRLVEEVYSNFYNRHREYFRIMMFVGFHDLHKDVDPRICQDISKAVVKCITKVSEMLEKSDSRNLSWTLWSLFVGIGHINEARKSLNIGRSDFEKLLGFAYRKLGV